MSSSSQQSAALDGLPKQFVLAMRTLFDIMDDKRTGYVKFSALRHSKPCRLRGRRLSEGFPHNQEIEHRWQDDGTKGLPKGVIDSLQKVTPPNGLLSFERFCAGLKICLLRNQVEHQQLQQPARPPSAPLPPPPPANTATVRPNNAMPQQRTLSMPQLQLAGGGGGERKVQAPYGPPKPPRTAAGLERGASLAAASVDRAEIRTALQNWQMGLIMGDQRGGPPAVRGGRSSGDGKPAGQPDQVGIPHKKSTGRRREPRRHTLQNGIDYNMLKRMKQIEQEKDVLMQGLQAVERARDWYLKQVAAVQEKMKYLGRMGSHMEQWTEAQQERLELQRARVLEVNRHLATLTDSWERGGLPLHINLAVHHSSSSSSPDILGRLKQQNHLLTEEVSKKSERITALEREKASLIRELYQTRSQRRLPQDLQDEAAFM